MPDLARTADVVVDGPDQGEKHGGGLGGAQVVLGAFPDGGRRAQPGPELVLGAAEQRHLQQRGRGQYHPDRSRLGAVAGEHAPRLLDQLQGCLSGHFDVEHSTFQLEAAAHAGHEAGTH
jgi:hypothetical protein